MKCSLGISNFLEEISSLSHSVVFLYFFALIAEEGFYYVDHNKLWKILKEMGIPDHLSTLPASWEICMQVKKPELELDMEHQTSSK